MTKRLLGLLMAVIMMLSLILTSCSDAETDDADDIGSEDLRNNIGITLYAITNDSSTEEGIAAVEEKLSNYSVAKYKTKIDLRLYKESEYQAAIDAMLDKFNEQEEAKKKADEEKKAADKSYAAYKKSLSASEREALEKKDREEARRAADEAKKEAAELQALIRAGKDVATINEVQMDILYVNGMEDYYSYIEQGLLMELGDLLQTTLKPVYDFVYPAFLTAATTNDGIFAIPNNKAVSTNETYFVVNTKLAEKYNVDWSTVRSITDLEPVFAQIKANEPNVSPILGDFDPENLVFYQIPGVTEAGHNILVFADQLLGGRFEASQYNKTYNYQGQFGTQFIDYCATKADYRAKGYFGTEGDFFLSVRELSKEEKAELEEQGLTLILYKGAQFTTQDALGGMFAISSKSTQDPKRVAEVLKLLITDTDFHNLFAFGIEGVNYVKSATEENVITIVDDSYSMDFFKTGNTFLGYIPDTMDPNYTAEGIQKNINSRIDPFLSFNFDWSDPASKADVWIPVFEEWQTIADDRFNQLMYGTPDYLAIIEQIDLDINNKDLCSKSYTDLTDDSTFRTAYGSVGPRLVALDKLLHPVVAE